MHEQVQGIVCHPGLICLTIPFDGQIPYDLSLERERILAIWPPSMSGPEAQRTFPPESVTMAADAPARRVSCKSDITSSSLTIFFLFPSEPTTNSRLSMMFFATHIHVPLIWNLRSADERVSIETVCIVESGFSINPVKVFSE